MYLYCSGAVKMRISLASRAIMFLPIITLRARSRIANSDKDASLGITAAIRMLTQCLISSASGHL